MSFILQLAQRANIAKEANFSDTGARKLEFGLFHVEHDGVGFWKYLIPYSRGHMSSDYK